ncbi:BsuBI/PstI family type II restriction endonuclease [Streptomyces sp. NPDC055992]|uniref:BsuBI/PstI family type II restriction endonuclease n=1 Tax=Streptomyces sp. NPDC055992 TaxID=3345673 RepID=UPI0035E3B929
MRKIISPEEAEHRLQVIFPRAAFDTVLSSPQAGMAVAALIYVDAVCNAQDAAETVQWARPTTVLWMSKAALEHDADLQRAAWQTAAARGNKQVSELHYSWGVPFEPAYRDTSRETLRDETFKEWKNHNAIRERTGLPKSSSKGIWSLLDDFADLFDPDLTGDAFREAADDWRDSHLDPGTRLKAAHALLTEADKHAVKVNLPNSGGTTRKLTAGKSSLIIKGVVETWSTARLSKPVVLAISEPGDKVHLGEEKALLALGITIDVQNVLPDVIIADIDADPVHFWIVEAVATDGVVTNQRRQALLNWAAKQNIKAQACSFLTAFESRNAAPARKRLKDLATGTWAWFADEPHHELAWYKVSSGDIGSGIS